MLVGIIFLLGASPQDATPPKVKVTVVSILASEHDGKIDPCVECLAKQIQKLEPRLISFHKGRMTCKSMAVGESESFDLSDDQKAIIVVKHGADKDNWVGLEVNAPELGSIIYSTTCGKFFPLVTRHQTKEHERLIIAIMVGPCKGK
jgi:hypothetical protein